jgi:heat shock protein HtpX
MGDRRRELFPPDRGLQARMAVALLINALLVAAVVALIVLLLIQPKGWALLAFPAMFLLEGFFASRRKGEAPAESRFAEPQDEERVRDLMHRLCAIADMEPPELKVEANRVSLSSTRALPFKRPRVSVTTGMLDILEDRELSAVLAHELSHIANHDATVMTILSGPSMWMLRGVRWNYQERWIPGLLSALLLGFYLIIPAAIIAPLSRMVSRYRELAADRGAAVVTGSPALVASALRRTFDDMHGRLGFELKLASPGDPFHFMPAAKREPGLVKRLWATHPRLRTRLRQMEEMEVNLQASRGSPVAALAADPGLD